MADRRIVITGGNGRLASQIALAIPGPFAVRMHRNSLDVTNPEHFGSGSVFAGIIHPGAVIIHCAAVLSVEAERDHLKAWAVNVEGTRNIAQAAAQKACRMVFISSDYVFGGNIDPNAVTDLTNAGWTYRVGGKDVAYRERDKPNPLNFYGQTKRSGEVIALESPNNLVLRAPFRYGPPWVYDNAFDDQWTSARWIGEVAPDIVEAALSDLTGILHIGGLRRNLHEFAESAGKPLRRSKRADWPGLKIPMDTSLDSSRWEQWKRSKQTQAA
jgi:dTDP-4-dehydrorhamnose reductase